MRLAIIADIHEDILSLKEVFRKIKAYHVDDVICLGDISGFSVPYYKYYNTRNAHECLSLIRKACSIVVLGNHDMHAARILPEKCVFFDFPDNWYQLDYQKRYELGNHTLWLHEENDLNPLFGNGDLDYLRTLKEYAVFENKGLNLLFSHYAYPNLSGLKKEFYTYKDEFDQHFDFMNALSCTISFTGHSHVKGFYVVTRNKFRQYRYRSVKLREFPVCISIPPVSRHEKRNGFCIFDVEDLTVQVIRL